MRMSHILLSAATAATALIAAVPASAEPATEQQFERDGMTYVYKVTTKGERTLVSGRRFPDGKRFSLTILNGKVTGVSGGMPVAFHVTDTASGGAQVAAR